MLHLAITFLVIALIAAFLGFAGVAALSFEGAKILFVIFLILAVLSFLGHGFRGAVLRRVTGVRLTSDALPVRLEHTKSRRGYIVNNKAAAQQRSNGSRLVRVLMADPDESLQPVYRWPLLQEGFELVTAVSGLECVARMREWHRMCSCSNRSCRGAAARGFSR